jgi:hypothetical protein
MKSEVPYCAFSRRVLDGGEWSTSLPGRFIPGESVPGTQWIGGCVAPEPVWTLWTREKSLAPARNRNRAIHTVGRCYIDWAVPADEEE